MASVGSVQISEVDKMSPGCYGAPLAVSQSIYRWSGNSSGWFKTSAGHLLKWFWVVSNTRWVVHELSAPGLEPAVPTY
ncbi:hypothetical protein [Chryseobacterium phocaeense]|uniref:hypothetical protein n=1 Tax=Chryseobacterium phocaeense TaxID=1816690 RepID=UPI001119A1BE|nr:hypothetical protein [Chryseobacterium phocaeense]